MNEKGRSENNPLTVDELNNFISEFFKMNYYFNNLYIKGEISSIDIYNKKTTFGYRKYAYISLKNGDKSKINCMIWSDSLEKIEKTYDLKNDLKIGKEIIVLGSVSAYPKGGTYNFIIKDVARVDGITGDILKREKLRKKLEDEGVFNRLKKQIVRFPKNVAIIAARDKAAIADVIEGINKRFPLVKINCYYSAMQGENALVEIPEKIKKINLTGEDDFIIICRGGGDLNDLKVFDDEKIVRAIIESKIPIVTAIGHEINISLSDLVSDKSYKTPTAAAEESFPDLLQILKDIKNFKNTINKDYNSILVRKNNKRLELYQSLLKRQPISKYKEIVFKNIDALKYSMLKLNNKFNIYLNFLLNSIYKKRSYISLYASKFIKNKENSIKNINLKLDLKNPKSILDMGYAKVFNKLNDVKSIKDVNLGDEIKTLFIDGEITSKIISKKENKNE